MNLLYTASSPRVVRAVVEPIMRARGFRRPVPELGAARRILVVRLDRIGDFVLSTPFLKGLRETCPSAEITLIVSPDIHPLALPCPYVNRTLVFDVDRTAPRMTLHARTLAYARRLLWPQRFEWALLPRWDLELWHGIYLAYFSGAVRRVGYPEDVTEIKASTNRDSNLLLTDRVAIDASQRHEALRSIAVLESMGLAPGLPRMELWPTVGDEAAAGACLARLGLSPGARLIAVAPGSWEPRKQWPAESFAQLLDLLRADLKAGFLLLGSPAERALGASLAAGRDGAVFNLAGALPLGATAALLKRCALYVGNDTGPKHMAAAAGVPVVEISGHPEDGDPWHGQSPLRFGAWQVRSRAVQPPAGRKGVASVDVARVRQAVLEMLAEGVPPCTA